MVFRARLYKALVKPNMTKTKASPWSKSDEEAVELRSVTSVMAANTQQLFLWKRPVNGSAAYCANQRTFLRSKTTAKRSLSDVRRSRTDRY